MCVCVCVCARASRGFTILGSAGYRAWKLAGICSSGVQAHAENLVIFRNDWEGTQISAFIPLASTRASKRGWPSWKVFRLVAHRLWFELAAFPTRFPLPFAST